jgi:hypothetical protein
MPLRLLLRSPSAINSSRRREEAALTGRLLGVGLPLMILGGWALAAWLPTEQRRGGDRTHTPTGWNHKTLPAR